MKYYSGRKEATELFNKTLNKELGTYRGIWLGMAVSAVITGTVFGVGLNMGIWLPLALRVIIGIGMFLGLSYFIAIGFESFVRGAGNIRDVFSGGSSANEVTKRVVGAREPSRRELDEILLILGQIVERMGARVKGFDDIYIVSNQGSSAFSMGTALYVTSGLIRSKYLGALLAHEIGHLQEGDGSTMLALSMMTCTVKEFEEKPALNTGVRALEKSQPIDYLNLALEGTLSGGWKMGLANIALAEIKKVGNGVAEFANEWTSHFRSQDYKADYFSVQAGYRDELIEYLEELSLLEGAVEQDLGFQAPAELRLDRVLATEGTVLNHPPEKLVDGLEPPSEPSPSPSVTHTAVPTVDEPVSPDLPIISPELVESPQDFTSRLNQTLETEVKRYSAPPAPAEEEVSDVTKRIQTVINQEVEKVATSSRRYKTPCANCLADIPEDYDSHRCEFCNSFLDEVAGYVAPKTEAVAIPSTSSNARQASVTHAVKEPTIRKTDLDVKDRFVNSRPTSPSKTKDDPSSWLREQEARKVYQERGKLASSNQVNPAFLLLLIPVGVVIYMFSGGQGALNEEEGVQVASSLKEVNLIATLEPTVVPTDTPVPKKTPTPLPTKTAVPTATPLPTPIQNRVFGTSQEFFVSPILSQKIEIEEFENGGYTFYAIGEGWAKKFVRDYLTNGEETISYAPYNGFGGSIHPIYPRESESAIEGVVGVFLSERIGGKAVFTSLFSVDDLVNACLGLVPTEYVDAVAKYPVKVFYYEDRLNVGFDQGQGYVFVCWADPNDSGKFSVTFRFEHFWVLGS